MARKRKFTLFKELNMFLDRHSNQKFPLMTVKEVGEYNCTQIKILQS